VHQSVITALKSLQIFREYRLKEIPHFRDPSVFGTLCGQVFNPVELHPNCFSEISQRGSLQGRHVAILRNSLRTKPYPTRGRRRNWSVDLGILRAYTAMPRTFTRRFGVPNGGGL